MAPISRRGFMRGTAAAIAAPTVSVAAAPTADAALLARRTDFVRLVKAYDEATALFDEALAGARLALPVVPQELRLMGIPPHRPPRCILTDGGYGFENGKRMDYHPRDAENIRRHIDGLLPGRKPSTRALTLFKRELELAEAYDAEVVRIREAYRIDALDGAKGFAFDQLAKAARAILSMEARTPAGVGLKASVIEAMWARDPLTAAYRIVGGARLPDLGGFAAEVRRVVGEIA